MSSGTTRYNVKMAKKKGDEKLNQNPQSDNEDQNFDEEPDFEDPEGFVDDIPDEGRSSRVLRLGRPYASPTHLPAFSVFVLIITYFMTLVNYKVFTGMHCSDFDCKLKVKSGSH